ncbi:hypothetical protein RHMOL_Rhmol04G0116900 [Rhododendron molle]|uniref:Uncharacterized protein n=1 Tax=Rhododendron molle TaxID=49168 RepID=A0ACC0NZ79_RHOML|nr:hypothetical protein RHMOL_Rhmol04G0116900 [Rhododendron molle]
MAAVVELVFIPAPGMGHLVSTVEMAKQLIGRDHRLSITVLIMKTPYDKLKVISTTQSLLLKAAEDRLKFVHLAQDDGAAVAELRSERPGYFMWEFVNMNKQHVRDHVTKMMNSTGSSPLAGFVVDMFCTPMMDVVAEFGLPTYAFFTSSCAFLGFLLHLDSLTGDRNQDVTELKDSDAELEVPVFVNPVPAKLLPSIVLHKEGGSSFMLGVAKRLRETKGIMVNTFEELESYAVKRLEDNDMVPPIYPVGPVLHLVKDENEEEEEVIQIMRWLDDQPLSSVVFLCFGSMGSFDGEQVREIAQALEQSKQRFLWSVRQPPPKGKVEMPSEYQDLNQVLPEGFLERTTEIGKVIGWAPQVAVLSHKAVGGFVSHCGWNSTLESLWCGVPVATWPIYAEQQMNAFQLIRELGLAVDIKFDYRRDMRYDSTKPKLVTADEIENGIKKLMENGDKSSTEGIKQKVKKMSEKSKIAIKEGGSSYNSIQHFIEDVIINVHSP